MKIQILKRESLALGEFLTKRNLKLVFLKVDGGWRALTANIPEDPDGSLEWFDWSKASYGTSAREAAWKETFNLNNVFGPLVEFYLSPEDIAQIESATQ